MNRLLHILQIQLEDTVKAHILKENGTYEKIDKRGKILINAQETFIKEGNIYEKNMGNH